MIDKELICYGKSYNETLYLSWQIAEDKENLLRTTLVYILDNRI